MTLDDRIKLLKERIKVVEGRGKSGQKLINKLKRLLYTLEENLN